MKNLKTGGRTAGTPNKLTKELRTVLKDFIFDELEALPAKLDELDTKDRIEIIIKIMPYVLPKVDNVKGDNGEPVSFGW
jgi:hypothetical protein